MDDLGLRFGDLYSDVYYDTNDTNYNESAVRDYGPPTTFLRGSSVLLLRAGFVLVQIGCIPITDVHMILLQNMIDIACGTIAYGVVGYILAFGHDAGGVIGQGTWIAGEDANMDNAVLGWSAVITSLAIFTTMVAGRMNYLGYIIVAVLSGGILQPILMHWVWADAGWMHIGTFVGHNVSYKDQGGGMIIHVFGGFLALCGALFLGRRIIRLRDLDESSLPPEAPASVIAGYFLLMIGFMGICLPAPSYEMTHLPGNYIGSTLICNIMAAAGGILTVILLQFVVSRDVLDHWVTLRCMQGAIAGIVIIAPGVDVYKPLVALGISLLGAIIFYFLANHLYVTSLEDYANIIPIHLVCGLIGTLLPPWCGSSEGLGATHKAVIHLGWQVVCDLIILITIVIPVLLFFLLLKCLGLLRNRAEERNHRRAQTIVSKGPPRSFFQRLFNIGDDPQFLAPGYRTKNEASLGGTETAPRLHQSLDYNNPAIKSPLSHEASKQEHLHNRKNPFVPEDSKMLAANYLKVNQIEEQTDESTHVNDTGDNDVQHLYGQKMRRQIYTVSVDMPAVSNNEAHTKAEGEVQNIEDSSYETDSIDEEVCSYTTRAQIHSNDIYGRDNNFHFNRTPTPYPRQFLLNGNRSEGSGSESNGESTQVLFKNELMNVTIPRRAQKSRMISYKSSYKLSAVTLKPDRNLPTNLNRKSCLLKQRFSHRKFSSRKLNTRKFNSANLIANASISRTNKRKFKRREEITSTSNPASSNFYHNGSAWLGSEKQSSSMKNVNENTELNIDQKSKIQLGKDRISSPSEFFNDFVSYFNISNSDT